MKLSELCISNNLVKELISLFTENISPGCSWAEMGPLSGGSVSTGKTNTALEQERPVCMSDTLYRSLGTEDIRHDQLMWSEGGKEGQDGECRPCLTNPLSSLPSGHSEGGVLGLRP